MARYFKLIFLNLFILFLLLEFSSFISVKLGLFSLPSEPTYGNTASFEDTDWRTEKEPWGVWHKKNFYSESKKSCFDVVYRSNNIGARDDKDYFKDEGDIILLGDSFIEGVGVNIENTFATLLGKTNKKVLNFSSAGSFGPLQQYIIYKNFASNFNHEKVIIFFLPANDFADNSGKYQKTLYGDRYRPYFKLNKNNQYEIYYPEMSTPSEMFPSAERQSIYKFKSFLIDFFYSANLYRQFKLFILSTSPSIQEVFNEKYGYNFEDDFSINGVLFFYEELFKLIGKDKSITFIVIPSDRDLREIETNSWAYLESDWYSKIIKLTQKYEVDFIDLALNDGEPSKDLLKRGQENWFLKCDGHWNNEGHKYAYERYMNHSIKD